MNYAMTLIKALVWDDFNVEHIKKHGVSWKEVEEACFNNPVLLEANYGRLRAVGKTKDDKTLSVVLAPKFPKGKYYPVTARPASRKERALYLLTKQGGL